MCAAAPGGGWCGVNRMISHFSTHPFQQAAVILFFLFFLSSWCKIASAAIPSPKQQWRPLPFFCIYPSSSMPLGNQCSAALIEFIFSHRAVSQQRSTPFQHQSEALDKKNIINITVLMLHASVILLLIEKGVKWLI